MGTLKNIIFSKGHCMLRLAKSIYSKYNFFSSYKIQFSEKSICKPHNIYYNGYVKTDQEFESKTEDVRYVLGEIWKDRHLKKENLFDKSDYGLQQIRKSKNKSITTCFTYLLERGNNSDTANSNYHDNIFLKYWKNNYKNDHDFSAIMGKLHEITNPEILPVVKVKNKKLDKRSVLKLCKQSIVRLRPEIVVNDMGISVVDHHRTSPYTQNYNKVCLEENATLDEILRIKCDDLQKRMNINEIIKHKLEPLYLDSKKTSDTSKDKNETDNLKPGKEKQETEDSNKSDDSSDSKTHEERMKEIYEYEDKVLGLYPSEKTTDEDNKSTVK